MGKKKKKGVKGVTEWESTEGTELTHIM